MSVKDSTMKKTRLGYQFDHNVYIGYQINDNRVVTIKELKNVANIATAASGGVANITLSTSALTEVPSNIEFDQIDFNNNGTITHEKIVPGYLVPGTTIPEGAKLCVIAPAGDGKAYRVYVSDKSISDIVTISGNQTITGNKIFSGSVTLTDAPLEIDYDNDRDYFLHLHETSTDHHVNFEIGMDSHDQTILTDDRVYSFPDKSGTVLLDADVINSVTSGSTSVVTSGAVFQAIADLPEPMIFKGTVGDAGDSPTITWANLPAASGHEGYTYKVITDHTSTPVCEAGDTIISNGSAWVVIPSGDEPSGTVTSVGITPQSNSHLTSTGGPITSAGSITIGVANGYSIPSTSKQSDWDDKLDENDLKNLDTTVTTALTPSASEQLSGSGSIQLHKVSKTGTYSDLIGKPTLGTAAAKDYTTSITSGGTDLPTSGAVYSAIAGIVDTNTWRPIQINGIQFLGEAVSTGYANLKSGSNISITGSNSHDITIAATNVVTTNTQQTITGQKSFQVPTYFRDNNHASSPLQVDFDNTANTFLSVNDEDTGYGMHFKAIDAGLTANRTYVMPDQSGTIALTSDIVTVEIVDLTTIN